jgi:hypothetical protein
MGLHNSPDAVGSLSYSNAGQKNISVIACCKCPTWHALFSFVSIKLSAMKQDMIKDLLEKTFTKLACPAKGHGMYAELEKALREAYNIGKAHQERQHLIKPNEEISYLFSRA